MAKPPMKPMDTIGAGFGTIDVIMLILAWLSCVALIFMYVSL